jgi:hypothetical protein
VEVTVPQAVKDWGAQVASPLAVLLSALMEQRFGPDEQGLRRINQIQEPGLLARLIVLLGTARSFPEAFSALPAT